jgi:hypothetical protein
MKFLVVLLFSTAAMAAPVVTKKVVHIKTKTVKENGGVKAKNPADCDEKAKKPIEIKPESISLSGNTGCSLDEAK